MPFERLAVGDVGATGRDSGLVPLGYDLRHQRAIFPEYVVHAWLQALQHVRTHLIESEYGGGTRARSLDAPDGIERREPILAKEGSDFLVGRAVFYIA